MANVQHNGLTGADLHESKGTAAATAGQVFVADGAGSGAFRNQNFNLSVQIQGGAFFGNQPLQSPIELIVPWACQVKYISYHFLEYSGLGGPGYATTITPSIGGVTLTGGARSESAVNVTHLNTVTGNNTLAALDTLKLTISYGSPAALTWPWVDIQVYLERIA